jgi:hypothetical protein
MFGVVAVLSLKSQWTNKNTDGVGYVGSNQDFQNQMMGIMMGRLRNIMGDEGLMWRGRWRREQEDRFILRLHHQHKAYPLLGHTPAINTQTALELIPPHLTRNT